MAFVSHQKSAKILSRSAYRFGLFFIFVLFFSYFTISFPVDIKWRVQTNSTSTQPALSKDYVFTVSDFGVVTALNKMTGAKVWEIEIKNKVSYGPTFASNLLFVPTENQLIAITSEGRILGNISFNSTISAPVLDTGSNLVVITKEGIIYVLSYPQNNLTNRNIIRSFKLDGEIDSSFVISGNKIYVSTVGGKLYSIDPTSSAILLYDIGYSVWRSKLAITNNSIYIPVEHSIYVVDVQGRLFLTKKISEGNLNSLSTDGERLYIGSDDGNLYALNLDGSVIWKFTTNNSIKSVPIVMQNSIIVSSRDNNIYSISKDGRLLWKLSFSDWPGQIVEDKGMLYLSSYDGIVYAISLMSCRITNPASNSSVLPLFAIAGDAYSENGIKSVEVRTLPGDWQTVSLHGSWPNIAWSGNMQITGFSEGEIQVQCRVIDNNHNQEQAPYYTSSYNFVFSSEKLPKINISYPKQVNVNQPFSIRFFTEDGAILTDLTVKVSGQTFKVTDKSGQFTYTPTTEGNLVIYIEKGGYQQRQIEIKVTKPLIQPIYVVIIFVIGIAVVIYTSIRKGTWR
ncbi:MAG: PQQ-binding-like beta-propeller repeat protein [Candidatus Micrarchaeota archaeon]|nr:PQQ-binding-like beta-propeller repeat protein [Candidatus Micrarchaeota archaeon]